MPSVVCFQTLKVNLKSSECLQGWLCAVLLRIQVQIGNDFLIPLDRGNQCFDPDSMIPQKYQSYEITRPEKSGLGPDELKSDVKRSPERAFVHPVSGVTKQNSGFSSAPSLRLSWTLQKRQMISIRHVTSNSSQLLQSWSWFTQNKKCFGCNSLGKGISCVSRSDSSDSLSTA